MPSSYSIIIKPQALEDILSIASYIAEESGDLGVALSWEMSIHEHLSRLELFPHGYSSAEVQPYRKLIHGRYLIYFRIDADERNVIVCRVVNGMMFLKNVGPIE